MYLLYVDESGTHGDSPAFILAGLAVHEQDAWHLQRRLTNVLARTLPRHLDLLDFELHAAAIKTPIRIVRGREVRSEWAGVPIETRFEVLRSIYGAIANYQCQDNQYPCALFGAVVDADYADREQRAYEEVLHKFDEMLTRQAAVSGVHQRGIVIHDKRIIERDVQSWAQTWRRVAGRIGVLTHLTDVPLFRGFASKSAHPSRGFRVVGPLAILRPTEP